MFSKSFDICFSSSIFDILFIKVTGISSWYRMPAINPTNELITLESLPKLELATRLSLKLSAFNITHMLVSSVSIISFVDFISFIVKSFILLDKILSNFLVLFHQT